LYILARELTSERDAVFAVLIMAISPFHIWYSQEGRMYSQLLFFSLLSSVLLMQALRQGKAHWWLYYVLASAAGMYTHVFMGLTLLGHFLWVLSYERRDWRAMTASGMVVALLFLPWVIFLPWVNNFLRGVTSVVAGGAASHLGTQSLIGRPGFSWAAIPYAFFVYAVGFSLGPSVAELHKDRSLEYILLFLPTITAVVLVFAPLLCIGILLMYKRYGMRSFAFTLFASGLPLVGTFAYSLAPRATFNARYTFVAFPFFCLFVGVSLTYLVHAKKIFGITLLIAVTVLSSVSTYNHFADAQYAKEDVRSAVRYWRMASQTEPLLTTSRSKYTTYAYLEPAEGKRHFNIRRDDPVSSINAVFSAQATSAAYVLLARDWNQAPEKAIREAFAVTQEKTFPGVKMLRVARRRVPETSDPAARLRAAG